MADWEAARAAISAASPCGIPRWARLAFIDGKFYQRTPDGWAAEKAGEPSLTNDQVRAAERVAFYREPDHCA